jgi:hypothetical protein
VVDDLPFHYPPEPANPGAPAPRKCYRHVWDAGVCARCDKVRDDAAVRRGRNNRSRGNRHELAVARTYGGEKTGPLGGAEDIRGKDFRTQVKTHQGVPPVRWRSVFAKLDTQADPRIPRLIERYLPGPGVPADDYFVFRAKDFLDWFGRDE